MSRTVDEGDRKLFKPHKNQHRNMLEKLAIDASPQALGCNVSLREGEQNTIAEAIVRLSRTADKQSCKDFVLGKKQLITVPLKLNGKATWDKTLNQNKKQHDNSMDICTWKFGELQPCENIQSYFQCPKCEHVEHSTCKNFQTNDLDNKQRCNGCSIMTKVVDWKCTCGTNWHRCNVHRHCGPVQKVTSGMSNAKRELKLETMANHVESSKAPRLDYSMSHEQMLEQETMRSKRKRMEEDEWMNEPTIDLGVPRIKTIRIASLGPCLRSRFVHPGGQ